MNKYMIKYKCSDCGNIFYEKIYTELFLCNFCEECQGVAITNEIVNKNEVPELKVINEVIEKVKNELHEESPFRRKAIVRINSFNEIVDLSEREFERVKELTLKAWDEMNRVAGQVG